MKVNEDGPEVYVGQKCILNGTVEGIGMDKNGITIYVKLGEQLVIMSHDEYQETRYDG